MKNTAWLDQLRREHPACRLAAFADLSAGMILSSSADRPVAQEHLDHLCTTAVELLDGDSAARVGRASGAAGQQGWPHYAMAADGGEILLFVRARNDPGDALCCLCDGVVGLDALIAAAAQSLDAISAGQ